jgi:hypothetical protein
VVSGTEAPRIALRAGCASRQIGGHDGSITRPALARLGEERAVAYVVERHNRPPSFTRGWRLLTLPGLPSRPELRAYVSPAAVPPGTGP